jgi:hypothetical protein
VGRQSPNSHGLSRYRARAPALGGRNLAANGVVSRSYLIFRSSSCEGRLFVILGFYSRMGPAICPLVHCWCTRQGPRGRRVARQRVRKNKREHAVKSLAIGIKIANIGKIKGKLQPSSVYLSRRFLLYHRDGNFASISRDNFRTICKRIPLQNSLLGNYHQHLVDQ